jgi:hypothetical protein
MTAGSTQRPERLTRNNALLLLVDHQVGLYTGIRDIDVLQLKHNIVGLTRAMLALKVPVIVTTTTEKMWGPLIPEPAEVLPGVPGIERTTVNAWDEKRFVDAVKATGRKNLIVATANCLIEKCPCRSDIRKTKRCKSGEPDERRCSDDKSGRRNCGHYIGQPKAHLFRC